MATVAPAGPGHSQGCCMVHPKHLGPDSCCHSVLCKGLGQQDSNWCSSVGCWHGRQQRGLLGHRASLDTTPTPPPARSRSLSLTILLLLSDGGSLTPVRESPCTPRLRSVSSYGNIRAVTTVRNLNKSLQNLSLTEEGEALGVALWAAGCPARLSSLLPAVGTAQLQGCPWEALGPQLREGGLGASPQHASGDPDCCVPGQQAARWPSPPAT